MLTQRFLHKTYAANVKYLSTASLKNPVASENISTPVPPLKSWKEIPGPSSLPVVGQLHHFLPGGLLYKTSGTELWTRLYNNYGRIVRIETMFRPTLLALFDPDIIAEVLHSENWLPVRPLFESIFYYRKHYKRSKEEASRHAGVAFEHGETWKDIRMKLNPVMMMKKQINLYADVVDEVAVDMVKRLKLVRDDTNMIRENLNKEINRWSLESFGAVALGKRLNCFDPKLDENSQAITLINNIESMFEVSFELDFKPGIWKYVATPTFKRAMEIYASVEKICADYVNQALKDLKAGRIRNGKEKSVIEKLLEVDEHLAFVMTNDLLIGGIDTTTNTILPTLYLLAKHPEKQKKLREEIASQGKGPYLKACLKESMRLMPVSSQNSRITTKEYNIAGYKIPKNMELIFCHSVITSMDSHFPKAKEFIPERWLVEKDHPLHHKRAHPFAFQPFGFGVRNCIGRHFAELQMEALIARLVESFEIDWVGQSKPAFNYGHLNVMAAPYNYVFKDVK